MGEMICFTSESGEHQAYLATPAGGSGPGIIVLQEWWGLVPHIKDVSDRFAREGFVALAPDLYDGESTTEPDDAATLMQALHIGETEHKLRGAVETLLALPGVSPKDAVGIVGFCMGGQLAMFAAGNNPAIKATVNFYGIHPKVQPSYRDIQGEVQGFFAERDHMASPEAVKALSVELTTLEIPHEFKTYPGTDHAFFNDARPEVYNPEAAKDAWQRMVEFFRGCLK
ncbi:MAG: dienelactone hydrolase family protein [Fimbriimonas sp.]